MGNSQAKNAYKQQTIRFQNEKIFKRNEALDKLEKDITNIEPDNYTNDKIVDVIINLLKFNLGDDEHPLHNTYLYETKKSSLFSLFYMQEMSTKDTRYIYYNMDRCVKHIPNILRDFPQIRKALFYKFVNATRYDSINGKYWTLNTFTKMIH